jgi:hypothetical protein
MHQKLKNRRINVFVAKKQRVPFDNIALKMAYIFVLRRINFPRELNYMYCSKTLKNL